MYSELAFVPKILLCGDEAEFFSRVGERPFKLVGHVEIVGENFHLAQDGKIFFNDELQDFTAFRKYLASGAVDYLIFNDLFHYSIIRNYSLKQGFISTKIITLELFKTLPVEFFYDFFAEKKIIPQFKRLSIRTLLDVDAYFARGQLLTTDDFTEIDCITDKPLLPITENIYAHVYKNFAEVGFKRYDAALLIERRPLDFEATFALLENVTDIVITFARAGSELARYLAAGSKTFENVGFMRLESGTWFVLRRRKAHENFCVYVVTHKPTPHENKLPEGYKIIHAGRALNDDLGYLGDDTGDNISELNPYLNEITALYWFWKNADDDVVGLSHYRRFFTESNDLTFAYDKILTRDAALKILERYDMIVSDISFEMLTQRELVQNDCGYDLENFGEQILRKHILKNQPDYLDAFDNVLNSVTFYKCNMFVTRRNIFDAYCKWLFSFFIDVTEEILRTINFDNLPSKQRRIMGFFSERLLTVWLNKNRLRIKELGLMFMNDV